MGQLWFTGLLLRKSICFHSSSRKVPTNCTTQNTTTHLTGKERDNETGLDYFGARYYANVQGRFTSPDPLSHSMLERKKQDEYITNPQRWNKYTYAINNPLRYVDPTGLAEVPTWDKLNKKIHDDLARRLGKGAEKLWNSWTNEQRQHLLNVRAVLMGAGVWGNVTRIAYGSFRVEGDKAYFTPNPERSNDYLAITTDRDITVDLEKAGFENRWDPKHTENQMNYFQSGDNVVLHLGTLKPPGDAWTTAHFDGGGGKWYSPTHIREAWNNTNPSPDQVTTAIGWTPAGQYLKGISESMDKLLTPPK